MAEEKGKYNPLKKTKKDLVESRGVGLRQSEWAVIDDLAKETGQTYHGVMQHIAREYLKQLQSGAIILETTETKKLPST
ncbi:MAG: hypothetical protein GY862_30350 [Gammaproteobacteria bacterium]|nr:hypothetical protein [Gammaproteobacteria bacterium]